MNCLPPTSLFVIGTLHQVQSRSGRSEKSVPVSGGGGVIGMRGILSERREACQPTGACPGRAKTRPISNFFSSEPLHLKKFVL